VSYRRRNYSRPAPPSKAASFWTRWAIDDSDGASCPADVRHEPRKVIEANEYQPNLGTSTAYVVEHQGQKIIRVAEVCGWMWYPAREVSQ
jgi:hypothetical protein